MSDRRSREPDLGATRVLLERMRRVHREQGTMPDELRERVLDRLRAGEVTHAPKPRSSIMPQLAAACLLLMAATWIALWLSGSVGTFLGRSDARQSAEFFAEPETTRGRLQSRTPARTRDMGGSTRSGDTAGVDPTHSDEADVRGGTRAEADRGSAGTVDPRPTRSAAKTRSSASGSALPQRAGAQAGARAATRGARRLAEETRLLKRAREALLHGDHLAVRRLLDEHRDRFPRPRLAEERDALMTELTCKLRPGDAIAALARFTARHPRSPQIERLRHRCRP